MFADPFLCIIICFFFCFASKFRYSELVSIVLFWLRFQKTRKRKRKQEKCVCDVYCNARLMAMAHPPDSVAVWLLEWLFQLFARLVVDDRASAVVYNSTVTLECCGRRYHCYDCYRNCYVTHFNVDTHKFSHIRSSRLLLVHDMFYSVKVKINHVINQNFNIEYSIKGVAEPYFWL